MSELRESMPGVRPQRQSATQRRGEYSGSPEAKRLDWRWQVGATALVNIVLGAWLIASPWVLGFAADASAASTFAAGVVIAVLALIRLVREYRAAWTGAVNAAAGAWLVGSAFWLADSLIAAWNAGLVGLVVAFVALLGASGAADRD